MGQQFTRSITVEESATLSRLRDRVELLARLVFVASESAAQVAAEVAQLDELVKGRERLESLAQEIVEEDRKRR